MDIFHHLPAGVCCACGHKNNASGCDQAERPSPGDYAICVRCAGLNIYADDMTLRKPSGADRLAAAGDPDVQRIRTIILAVNACMKAGADDTTH
jgi:hypothetical protein